MNFWMGLIAGIVLAGLIVLGVIARQSWQTMCQLELLGRVWKGEVGPGR